MQKPAPYTPPDSPTPEPPKTPKPTRKTDRREYDTVTRRDLEWMRFRKPVLSYQEIEDETAIPRQTVKSICERDPSLLRTARPTRANNYKISRETILEIEAEMDGHWGRGSMETQELIDFYDLDCAPQTLLNSFRREGIGHFWAAQDKYLLKSTMEEREAFAYTLRDGLGWTLEDYKYVLYSDACHFAVNQRKKRKCWRRRGRNKQGKLHRNRLDKTQKRIEVQKVSTTVAAMIGWNYKSQLAFLPRHIKGDDYIEHFLKPIVQPFFETQRAEAQAQGRVYKWVLEEDNEGAHGITSVLNAPNDFKNTHKIKQMKPKQPGNSGDLSPIENVWRILKQRVKKRKAKNQDQLRRYVLEEWDNISIEEINKLIKTMPERIDQCIEREGDVTVF